MRSATPGRQEEPPTRTMLASRLARRSASLLPMLSLMSCASGFSGLSVLGSCGRMK